MPNSSNLCHRKDDFSVEAEWHFYYFATLLGKTVGDGAAGTLKQLAAFKSSLQCPYAEQITAPKQLFDYACLTIQGIEL